MTEVCPGPRSLPAVITEERFKRAVLQPMSIAKPEPQDSISGHLNHWSRGQLAQLKEAEAFLILSHFASLPNFLGFGSPMVQGESVYFIRKCIPLFAWQGARDNIDISFWFCTCNEKVYQKSENMVLTRTAHRSTTFIWSL